MDVMSINLSFSALSWFETSPTCLHIIEGAATPVQGALVLKGFTQMFWMTLCVFVFQSWRSCSWWRSGTCSWPTPTSWSWNRSAMTLPPPSQRTWPAPAPKTAHGEKPRTLSCCTKSCRRSCGPWSGSPCGHQRQGPTWAWWSRWGLALPRQQNYHNNNLLLPWDTSSFFCPQVLQQEEQIDKDWAVSEKAAPGGPRPRRLKQKWREAVEEAADSSLPQRAEFTAGELDKYLDRLRARMVEDLGAANRNVVSIYPEEYQAFQVRRHQRSDSDWRSLKVSHCSLFFLIVPWLQTYSPVDSFRHKYQFFIYLGKILQKCIFANFLKQTIKNQD